MQTRLRLIINFLQLKQLFIGQFMQDISGMYYIAQELQKNKIVRTQKCIINS